MMRREFLSRAAVTGAAALLAPVAALARPTRAAPKLTADERAAAAHAAALFLLVHPTLRWDLSADAIAAALEQHDGMRVRREVQLPASIAGYGLRWGETTVIGVARGQAPADQARALLVAWAELRLYPLDDSPDVERAVVFRDPTDAVRWDPATRRAEAFAEAVRDAVGRAGEARRAATRPALARGRR